MSPKDRKWAEESAGEPAGAIAVWESQPGGGSKRLPLNPAFRAFNDKAANVMKPSLMPGS